MAALVAFESEEPEPLSEEFLPQAVAESASAAEAMPTVVILVIRRKRRVPSRLTESASSGAGFAAIVTRVDVS
ncbi:hypothetical protein GCM10010305_06360 [Streptomyces termitum]|uniref:Uncharacterized protein n=1 Tax=Streptomyces termitum TaxID=67368 RepID=A0A918SQV3_9ACTN|nr:hypothetical protein GCM10010305_06360 [Streptomyces termitum]